MADLAKRPQFQDIEEPETARQKRLKSQLQEKKSRLFSLKQSLDLCKQKVADIQEGEMSKIEYSMIMIAEQIKQIELDINTVIIE